MRAAYAGDGRHAPSYYAATAHPAPDRPKLTGTHSAEVCVVGAGYSGLSCALHLAERGDGVTLVEGARVGWGASGRNGGQIINGLNAPLARFRERYGEDVARFVAGMIFEGGQIIRDRVARYGIACDLQDGNVFTALTARHMATLRRTRDLMARYGHDRYEILDRGALRDHVRSDLYAGGMRDPMGGHLHPLNLALGEAAAFESLGGRIHEMSPVQSVATDRTRPRIRTAEAELTADTLVLCGNAYLGHVVPAWRRG